MATEPARAKVNLCLHVTGQRADGYHLLDSLVVFAGVADSVTVTPAAALSLQVTGPFGPALTEGDNLVLRAARAVGATAAITLEKHLPVSSGIGGGSADAAACLRALARLGHDLPDLAGQLALGADVPVCVAGQPTRMGGVGDQLDPVPGWPELHAVLVNPGVAVSTPQVFAALDRRDHAPLEWPPTGDPVVWLAEQRNDLEPAAIRVAPVIGDVLAEIRGTGARLARMSGSGATCFGLFTSAGDARQAAKALERPGWWVVATPLIGSGSVPA